MMATNPDFECLFSAVEEQSGYFTYGQARGCGFADRLIAHHTETGRFRRVHRAVYRWRDFPTSPREEVVAAWLAVGKDVAVVSHESALDLHELSNVIPNYTHLTVPRSVRNHPKLPGVKIHTTTRGLGPGETVTRDGMRVTSVARTIADAADAGTQPEQIEMAIHEALQRGITTPARLRSASADRSRRVQALVERAIGGNGT
jgi:predicted transcriptional regulator of viral defense system